MTFDLAGADMLDFFVHEAKASLFRAREVDGLPGVVADGLDAAIRAVDGAQAALAARVECERCHGTGEVMVNPSRRFRGDPQLVEGAGCPVCHTTGMVTR